MAEFVEAESAGKAGRKRFGAMLAFLGEHPEVRLVVAHKLDRLYRNFTDPGELEEELGVRSALRAGRHAADSPGQLLRDIQLSVAKFYLGNLREEVKKGLARESGSRGLERPGSARVPKSTGNRAPSSPIRCGLRWSVTPSNATRPAWCPFPIWPTNCTPWGSLTCAPETSSMRARFTVFLRNPVYAGFIRFKGTIYQGTHEP